MVGVWLLFALVLYHNRDCGTSRNALAMSRQSGVEPVVIEYPKMPPTREKLRKLIAAMCITSPSLLREKDTPYAEWGLADTKWTDDELLTP
jgi:arsenate reductase